MVESGAGGHSGRGDHSRSAGDDVQSAAIRWRKSSRSGYSGNCVEIAHFSGGQIGIRDSKANGRGPIILLDRSDWSAFAGDIKDGQFDLP